MKTLVAMRDFKLSQFSAATCFDTAGAAERAFGDAINDGKSMMFQHPEDFSLYVVGHFDEDSGAVTCVSPPTLLCDGLAVKRNV